MGLVKIQDDSNVRKNEPVRDNERHLVKVSNVAAPSPYKYAAPSPRPQAPAAPVKSQQERVMDTLRMQNSRNAQAQTILALRQAAEERLRAATRNPVQTRENRAKETLAIATDANRAKVEDLWAEKDRLEKELQQTNRNISAAATSAATTPEGMQAEFAKQDQLKSQLKDTRDKLASYGQTFDAGDFAKGIVDQGLHTIGSGFSSTVDLVSSLIPRAATAIVNAAGGDADYRDVIGYKQIHEWNERVKSENSATATKYADNIRNGGWLAQKGNEWGVATVNAIPMALMAFSTGGSNLAAHGADVALRAANTVPGMSKTIGTVMKSMVRDPNYWVAFFNVTGNSYNQAIEDGATENQAVAFALTNGAINAALEGKYGIQELAKKPEAWTFKKFVDDAMLGEAREEVLQGVAERALQDLVYNKGNGLSGVLNPATALDEAVGGAVVGGILGGAGMASTIAANSLIDSRNERIARRLAAEMPSVPNGIDAGASRTLAQAENLPAAQSIPAPQATSPAAGNVSQTGVSNLFTNEEVFEQVASGLGEHGQGAIRKAFQEGTDPIAYAGDFIRAYNAVREGRPVPNTPALNQEQLQAAMFAGNNDKGGQNGGEVSLRGSSEWRLGTSPAQQVQTVEGTTGRAPGEAEFQVYRADASRAADRGINAVTPSSVVDAAEYIPGAANKDIFIISKGSETESMKSASKFAGDIGMELNQYADGDVTIDGVSGVRGVYMPSAKKAFVNAANRAYTSLQLAKHEGVHFLKSEGRLNTDSIHEWFKSTHPQAYNLVMERYKDTYDGMDLTDEEIFEEFIGDSMGGMNVFNSLTTIRQEMGYRMADVAAKVREQVPEAGEQAVETGKGEASVKSPQGAKVKAASRSTSKQNRYSYAGENAKEADTTALSRASEMEEAGEDAETIRKETGWFRGMDGKWRFEIDDSDIVITSDTLKSRFFTLGDVIKHDALFRNYPDLKDMSVYFETKRDGQNGSYDPQFDNISLDEGLRNRPNDLKEALIHEIQHAIQNREDFTSGASVQYWQRRIDNGTAPLTESESQSLEDAKREYRELAEDSEFIAEAEALYASVPDMPRGEVDMDTFEQITEDPPEWQEFDRRRDALKEKYGDKVFAFFDAKRHMEAAQNYRRSAADLYMNTAGEIEARDSASRADLTAEQRENLAPDRGNKNTVFARGAGQQYSLKEFEDGTKYVDLDVDQDLFDGLSKSDARKAAERIIKERFVGKVIGSTNRAYVNSASAKEYTNPARHLDDKAYFAKMRASTELGNLMDAGTNFRSEPDGRDGHRHERATGGFSYFDIVFKVGDNYYSGVINVENNNIGSRFKDVTKIKDITMGNAGSIEETQTSYSQRDSSIANIAPDSQSGKKKYSLSSETTEEQIALDLESLQKMDSETAKENAKEIAAIGDIYINGSTFNGKPAGRTLAVAFKEELIQDGTASLIGKTVHTAEDLATLAQVYRNPRFETMRYFFVNDAGEVVYHTGVSSKLVSASAITPDAPYSFLTRVARDAKDAGATSMYVLHNHPSGDPTPSNADISTQKLLDKFFRARGIKSNGGVVINSNKYAHYRANGSVAVNPLGDGVDRLLSPEGRADLVGMTIQRPSDFANLTKAMQLSDDYSAVVYLNAKLKVNAVQEIHNAIASDEVAVSEWVENNRVKYGGEAIAFVTEDPAAYNVLKNLFDDGLGVDVIYAGRSTLQESSPKRSSLGRGTGAREVRFSLSSPAEETDRFIALHNMNESAMRGVLELEGFAAPSVALVPAELGHNEFGPISVVFGKESVDPKANKQNKIFIRDAWTPTFPGVDYKISMDVQRSIEDRVNKLLDKAGYPDSNRPSLDYSNMEDKLNRFKEGFAEAYERDSKMKLAFLTDRGETVEIPMRKRTDLHADVDALKEIPNIVDLDEAWSDSSVLMKAEPEIRKFLYNYTVENGSQHVNKRTGRTIAQDIADRMFGEELSFSELNSIIYDAQKVRRGETTVLDTAALEDSIEAKMTGLEDEYRDWLNDLGKGVIEKRGIKNGKDMFTASGNRRTFEQLHEAYTLNNIVKAMTKLQAEQGEGHVLGGHGAIRGASAQKFTSVENAREHIGMIGEEDNAAYEKWGKDVFNLCERLAKQSGFGAVDDVAEYLAEIIPGAKSADDLYRKMQKESYWLNVDRAKAEELFDLIKTMRSLPTNYFEAKLYRAVAMNEPLAYVVPDDINQDLLDEMNKAGLNIITYDAGDNIDRLKKINAINGARFSRSAEDVEPVAQAVSSAATSIKQVPALFKDKNVSFSGVNIDIGGGRFDLATNFLREQGVENYVFDPYNRSEEENSRTLNFLLDGNKADTATCANVLNVIAEEDARANVILEAAKSIKPGGTAYFMVYEGDGSGVGRQTSAGWQNNRKTASYVGEIEQYFESVTRKGKLIIARDPAQNLPKASWETVPGKATRYSRSIDDLQRQNADLQKRYDSLAKALTAMERRAEKAEGQLRRTENPTMRADDVTKISREVLKRYQSTIKAADIQKQMQALGDRIVSADLEWNDLKDGAVDIARDVVGSAKELINGEQLQEYKNIRNYFKRHRMFYEDHGDIPEYDKFRRHNFGRFGLTKSDTSAESIDSVYDEAREIFGEAYFPSEITAPADQLQHISDVLDSFGAVYENPYDINMAEAIEYCSNDILEALLSESARQTPPTFADKAAQDVARVRWQGAQKAEEAVARVREQRDQQIAALKQHYKDIAAARRARKADSNARTKLLHIARRLANKKLPAVNRALIQQYIGDLDLVSKGITGQSVENLTALRQWYENRKETDPDFLSDPGIEKTLSRLEKRHIAEMTAEEVEELTNILLNIENELRTEKQFIDSQIAHDTAVAGIDSIRDIENSEGLKPGSMKYGADRFLVNGTLSPERMMHRTTGYNDNSPLYVATKELSKGQRNMYDFQMRADKMFRKWTEDKAFTKKVTGKNAEEISITGSTGKGPATVKITPAMRMSLYLHSKNDQNLRHIAGGGITVPDMTLYKKGNLDEAYASGTTIRLTPSQVREIVSGMSAEEKAFADKASAYFNGMSQEEINATSEKLKGYSLATVDNYFPINTDRSFLKTDFESLKHDGTIEGMGFLKERNNSSSPILLRDMNAVLNQSISQTSRYVGLAIPVRNFNKLWTVTEASFDESGNRNAFAGSVQQAVKRKWGTAAYDYIEKMMKDVNGGDSRPDTWGKLLNNIRSNYAGAVLTLNASVAMKQAASYPTAGSVVGFRPLMKALTNMHKADLDLISKYTPLLWYRSQGFSTQELGDMAKQDKSLPKILNWIQGIDVATTTKLWKAAEYYIRQENKDLKAGTDAYYRAVADVYNRIIEETQPNYTTMQRPDFLRTDNSLLQSIMMFKTQPFQNFNILYDAFKNMDAKRKAYVNTKSDESKLALQQATKDAVNAAWSQIASAAVFAGMTFAWNVFRGKVDDYEDDDDEMTILSALEKIGKDMLASSSGMIPFGSDVWEFLASKLFGDKYYGFDSITASAINDFATAMNKAVNSLSDIWATVSNGESVDWNDQRIKWDQVIGAASKMLGVPYDNVANLFEAIFLHSAKAAQGEYAGTYAYLRLTTSSSSNAGAYYDLLYRAYKNDSGAHKMLYNKMVSDGFDPDKIKTNIEKRMKTEQGVNSVKDLSHRYEGAN